MTNTSTIRKAAALTSAVAAIVTLSAQSPCRTPRLTYPAAERGDARDVFHGVTVADPYRWLEDLESPKTKAWIKAQDDLTRQALDGPGYDAYRRRLERLANVRRFTTPVQRGKRHFFFENDSNGLSGRVLMVRDGSAAARTLADLRARGASDTLSWVMAPDPAGETVAYGATREASRWLTLRFLDVATGHTSDESLENLHSSMGSIAWTRDGRALYYVRFDPPRGSLVTAPVTGAAVMRHTLGTPQARDERVFQLTDSPNRNYAVTVTDDGHWLVVTSSIGSAPRQQVWARDLRVPGSPLVELFADARGQFAFLGSRKDQFWFQTSAGAPRQRVVRVDPARSGVANWIEVIPQPDDQENITYTNFVADRLIVFSTRDAAPRGRIHTLEGKFEREVQLPPLGTVWGPGGGGPGFAGRTTDSLAYYSVVSIANPGTIFRLDPKTGRSELFMQPTFSFDPNGFVGRQIFYESKDGTRIPMFIAHRKDVQPDGARAAILYGYGAFGWSAFPWFQPQILAWMEAGGVYALPGLRGGGEYGERWHDAGVREKKQTSVDDYIAAAEWLIRNKYAAPGKVVANGGSASGHVAAAAMVQRPSLFGAAVIDIPALDLVRYDRHSDAASWVAEFGSTAKPEEFKALRALSPYHNLNSRVCYPPTLVLAGEKDDIAVPSHAYKFIAALQASQPCANPALLQVAWSAGHTFGSSNETSGENWARQLAFISKSLGPQGPGSQGPQVGSARRR
jgi:prolyl oligopeptidase